jgi:hypothetical protein
VSPDVGVRVPFPSIIATVLPAASTPIATTTAMALNRRRASFRSRRRLRSSNDKPVIGAEARARSRSLRFMAASLP